MLNDYISKQINKLARKKVSSSAESISKESLLRAIFFSATDAASIESLTPAQISQSIQKIEEDYLRFKKPSRSNKVLQPPLNSNIQNMKNKVDSKIVFGQFVPMLMPVWDGEKIVSLKCGDVREWRKKDFDLKTINEDPEFEIIQQKQDFGVNQSLKWFEEKVDPQKSIPKRYFSLDDSLTYEGDYVERENFQQYYKNGTKFLYEYLPKIQNRVEEFKSIDDFVDCNFVVCNYITRYYYKNLDPSKRPFTSNSHIDKTYERQVLKCIDQIVPEIKQIIESKFFVNQDSEIEGLSIHQKTDPQLMITQKDWLRIFQRVYFQSFGFQYQQRRISRDDPKKTQQQNQQIKDPQIMKQQTPEENNFKENLNGYKIKKVKVKKDYQSMTTKRPRIKDDDDWELDQF